MKSMLARNRALLLLAGLCLLCISVGFQSAETLDLWLGESAVRPSSLKLWSETLKAGSMFLFAVAIFCNLAIILHRRIDPRQPPSL